MNIDIPADRRLNFFMSSFQNPPYVKDQIIYIQINYNTTIPLSSTLKNITTSGYIPGAINSKYLNQGSFKRAAKTNYTITFNIKDNILLDGKIVLIFPSEISLSSVKNVFWKSYQDIFENNVNFLKPADNMITLSSLFTLKSLVVNSSGVLTIRIDGIQNPSLLINTTSIKIQTTNNQGDLIDQVIFFSILKNFFFLIY